MKRTFLLGLLICFIISCETSPNIKQPDYQSSITSEKSSDLVTLFVTADWKPLGWLNNAGLQGFNISILNNTEKIVRISWEKSSILYNGQSSKIVINGQKYIDANNPMSSTVLPGKSKIDQYLLSAAQLKFVERWNISPIPSDNIVIVLCIQSNDIEDYYTIRVSTKSS